MYRTRKKQSTIKAPVWFHYLCQVKRQLSQKFLQREISHLCCFHLPLTRNPKLADKALKLRCCMIVSGEKIPLAVFRSSNYGLGRQARRRWGAAVISSLAVLVPHHMCYSPCYCDVVVVISLTKDLRQREPVSRHQPPTSRETTAVWLFYTGPCLFVLAVGH